MKSTITWTITALLILLDIYLLFVDPLEKQLHLYKILGIWVIIAQVSDYSLRKNETYSAIRNIAITLLFAISYFVIPV